MMEGAGPEKRSSGSGEFSPLTSTRVLTPGDGLSFESMLRVFIDEELEEYLDPEDDHYFVRHLKGGGRRADLPALYLDIRIEPPYAEFVFHNPTTRLVFVIVAPPSVAVLDDIGRQAECLVIYEDNPDGSLIKHPVEVELPRPEEGKMDMESIVRFVERQSKQGDP